jgi:hypothetical protein
VPSWKKNHVCVALLAKRDATVCLLLGVPVDDPPALGAKVWVPIVAVERLCNAPEGT